MIIYCFGIGMMRRNWFVQVKNETHALWRWHRNQDVYGGVGDEIFIVREPDKCLVDSSKRASY